MEAVPNDHIQLDMRYSQDTTKVATISSSPPTSKTEPFSVGSLGNAAYGLTAFMAACSNLGAYKGDTTILLAVALINGGLTQFICGFFEFKRGDIFGGTAFSSFGAYWISFFVYSFFLSPNVDPNSKHMGEGFFLLVWCIFTAYMTIASFKLNIPTFILLLTLELTYLFLCIGTFLKLTIFLRLAGATGIISSGCGFYLSAKDVLLSTFKDESKKDV